MSPKFERREETDYVVREGITTDDPVGAYILKRFNDNPRGVTRLSKGGKAVSYLELLDLFEGGNMPRATYESIQSRIDHTNTPLAVLTEQRKLGSFADSELARLVFGDKGMPEQTISLRADSLDYFFNYVRDHLGELPEVFDLKKEIAGALDRRNPKDLGVFLQRYSSVLRFNMQQEGVSGFMRWRGNEDLRRALSEAQKEGVFAEAKVYAAAEKRFRKK